MNTYGVGDGQGDIGDACGGTSTAHAVGRPLFMLNAAFHKRTWGIAQQTLTYGYRARPLEIVIVHFPKGLDAEIDCKYLECTVQPGTAPSCCGQVEPDKISDLELEIPDSPCVYTPKDS